MTPELFTYFECKARQLSGALKEPANMLYGSFHYPEFTLANAARNTVHRFEQFEIPEDLTGKTVLDVGSNTGAVSFEFARRGATVIGLEYNKERVDFCNELSKALLVPATFYCCDANGDFPSEIPSQFDIVSCTALDAYMDDRFALYQKLADRTKEICYLESNFPSSASRDFKVEVEDTKSFFSKFFPFVNFIGYSTAGGRRIFTLSHNFKYFKRYRSIEPPWRCRRYHSYDDWAKVSNALKNISLPQVPTTKIDEPYIIGMWFYENAKKWNEIDANNAELMQKYRQQMIDFIVGLNKLGYAHRDLHVNNLLFEGDKLIVIDWEWVTENRVPLQESYDLTGEGCPLPGVSPIFGAQTIFAGYGMPPIAKFFNISMDDFEKRNAVAML